MKKETRVRFMLSTLTREISSQNICVLCTIILSLLLSYGMVHAQASISSFAPTSGPIGTVVTITGSGFNPTAAQNIVLFNNSQALVTIASATSLTVIVPVFSVTAFPEVTNLADNTTAATSEAFVISPIIFAPKVDYPAGSGPTSVSLGDIDGDGKPDMAVANSDSNSISIMLNTSSPGSMSFAYKVDYVTGIRPIAVSIGDIDGDGKPDLAVANYGSNTVSVLRNTSSIGIVSFAPKSDFLTDSSARSVCIGDLDNDGKLDLAVANYNSDNVSILRNISTPGILNFATKVDFPVGVHPISVCFGDIDGDSKADLAIANNANFYNSNSTVSVLRNNSNLGIVSFASKVDLETGANPSAICIGDIDGDGKLDLAVSGNNSQDIVWVFRNKSTPGILKFAFRVFFEANVFPTFVSIGDIDNDGRLDLAVSNPSDNEVSVLSNTSMPGTVSFTIPIVNPAGGNPFSVNMKDMDGDGATDLVVTNYGGNTVSVIKQVLTCIAPTPAIMGNTIFCNGDSTTLDAGVFNSYNWSTGAATQTIPANIAGTFTVTVTNANGCSASASVTTTINANPTPAISGVLSFCDGDSTTLAAGVFSNYLWSTGASTQTINVSTAGTYTVTVSSSNSCTASNLVTTKIENFHEFWSNNPAINMAICNATNNQAEPKAVSDGLGGAIITWYDSRSGSNKDIYAQRIDASGIIKWTLNGLAICNAAGDQTLPKIVTDEAGGAIITWEDYRSGSQCDIYAQRVNAAGTVMWAANGVAICMNVTNQLTPNLIADANGGAIITWTDFRNGVSNADIYAQRISNLGVIKWASNGVPVCNANNNQTAPVLVTNGSGGAVITWTDLRNGNADIYTQRINKNGIIQWAVDGLPMCFLPSEINKVTMVSDNTSGAIVTWEDFRNGTNNADIYAQRVNATGVALWTVNGLPVCNSAGNQFQPAIISDGGKGAILTWRDKRGSSFDIYTQKIDAMGVGLWTNNGLAVCAFTENQSNPALVSDFEGGAFITWQDFRNSNFDIYAQKINSAGVNQFISNGIVIGNAANSQQYPFIISDNNGGAIVTWNDSDIYAQNINANGTLGNNYIAPTTPSISASTIINCGVVNTLLGIASGSLNSASNWYWYSGSCGGTPIGTGTSVTVNPSVTTTYFVRGESNCVTSGSCSSIQITVTKPKPVGLTATNITATSATNKWDTVTCAVGYKYQYRKQGVTAWTTNNINSNNPNRNLSGLLASSTYQWRVKSKFADGSFSIISTTAKFTTLALRSGLEPIENTNELVVFPNPAYDKLNLEFPFTDGDALVTIINALGQTVLQQTVSSVDDAILINIQNLTEGLYFVTVKNGDNTFNSRFIKK